MGRKNRRRGGSGHRQMHLRLAGGTGYVAPFSAPQGSYGREERRRQAQLMFTAFHRTEVEWPGDPCPYPEDYRPTENHP